MMVLTAVATLGGLTALLTTLLVIAHIRFHVDEDPRIDVVEGLLPGANCGACGSPGCRAFAEALVRGEAQPAACTVSMADDKARVADVLGVSVGTAVKRIARLACAGGSNVARQRAAYIGPSTCLAAAQVGGGGKDCSWGCLELGDCVVACDFDAIRLDQHDLPQVDADLCTACGDCVVACPKDLFSIQSMSDHLWVKCRNELAGDEILPACRVACTACGRCAMDAPGGSVSMAGGLPVIDADQLRRYSEDEAMQAIERCPTGAIVWVTDDNVERTGRETKKVVRQAAVRPAST